MFDPSFSLFTTIARKALDALGQLSNVLNSLGISEEKLNAFLQPPSADDIAERIYERLEKQGRMLYPDPEGRKNKDMSRAAQDVLNLLDNPEHAIDDNTSFRVKRDLRKGRTSSAKRLLENQQHQLLSSGSRQGRRSSGRLWRNLGTLEQPENAPQAMEHFQKSVSMNPDDPMAWNRWGRTVNMVGGEEELEAFRQGVMRLERRGGSPMAKAMAFFRLSKIYKDLGEDDKAKEMAKKYRAVQALLEAKRKALGTQNGTLTSPPAKIDGKRSESTKKGDSASEDPTMIRPPSETLERRIAGMDDRRSTTPVAIPDAPGAKRDERRDTTVSDRRSMGGGHKGAGDGRSARTHVNRGPGRTPDRGDTEIGDDGDSQEDTFVGDPRTTTMGSKGRAKVENSKGRSVDTRRGDTRTAGMGPAGKGVEETTPEEAHAADNRVEKPREGQEATITEEDRAADNRELLDTFIANAQGTGGGSRANVQVEEERKGPVSKDRLDHDEEKHRMFLEEAIRADDKPSISASYHNLGKVFEKKGEFAKAEAVFRERLAFNLERGKRDQVVSDYGNLGAVCQQLPDLSKAEEAYLERLALNEEDKNTKEIISDCQNLGDVYNAMHEFAKAEAMFMKRLEHNRKHGDMSDLVTDYDNLGGVMQAQENFYGAKKQFQKALDLCLDMGNKQGMAEQYNNLGKLLLAQGDPDEAALQFQTALEKSKEADDEAGYAKGCGNLGCAYIENGDLDAAETLLKKSLAIHKKLKNKPGMAEQYGNLAALMEQRNDPARAVKMHQARLKLEKSLNNQSGMAEVYGKLGLAHQSSGNVAEAESMLKKAMELESALGRQEGVAKQCANLGRLYQNQGSPEQAREMYTQGMELFTALKKPKRAAHMKKMLEELSGGGDSG